MQPCLRWQVVAHHAPRVGQQLHLHVAGPQLPQQAWRGGAVTVCPTLGVLRPLPQARAHRDQAAPSTRVFPQRLASRKRGVKAGPRVAWGSAMSEAPFLEPLLRAAPWPHYHGDQQPPE